MEPRPPVPPPDADDGGSQTPLAMGLMVSAMLMLPGIDAIAKWLSGEIPPAELTWFRFAVQSLLMFPLALRVRGPVRLGDFGVHALRGILLALTTVIFFTALRHLPMADAIATFFVEPLILTMLAAAFLGEPVGWRRVSAVLAGLGGAVLVIRPGFAAFGWPSLLPLGAAISFALYLLLTRRMAMREDPARMQLFAGLFGLAFMSAVLAAGHLLGTAALAPTWPRTDQWLLLIGLGVIATVGHLLVVHAFKRAPAVLLAPFQYLEIVSATLLGLALFGDFPDLLTWLGIAVIVGAGLYVFHRERVRAGREATA